MGEEMNDRDLSVCQLCSEPIWTFICADCIGNGIRNFLPSHFTKKFNTFHKDLLSHFSSMDATNKCLQCKNPSEFTVCPYCYTNEVHTWLEKKNRPLAEKFIKIFSFGLDYDPLQKFVLEEDSTQESSDMGICDECGEYGEELVSVDGEWVCKNCAWIQEDQ